MAAFRAESGFGENTHRATAMGEVCDDIEKQYEDRKVDTTLIIGAPQRVKLPFACEEDIVHWECQLFENEDEDYQEDIGTATYFNVLSIDLVGIAKKKTKKKGGTRVIGSPSATAATVEKKKTTKDDDDMNEF